METYYTKIERERKEVFGFLVVGSTLYVWRSLAKVRQHRVQA